LGGAAAASGTSGVVTASGDLEVEAVAVVEVGAVVAR